MSKKPLIIAHRGYTADYPENTLPALQAAVDVGVAAVEFDVQFSRDHIPVVFHDADLWRLTGERGAIAEFDYARLAQLSACDPERFGTRHRDIRIPRLVDAIELLKNTGELTVFVEIKRDSLPTHRIPAAVQDVARACEPLGERAVIISMDPAVIQEARSLRRGPVGWVLSEWSTAEAERAHTLEPDYLFCDEVLLPPTPSALWAGSWQWAVYEVNDIATAKDLVARGVNYIETKEARLLVEQLQ
ncbi:hypothetical protein CAI21_12895 [Alkalilimnicola ehrlichii]|uniref:GP-PDE domain-containing protein n=1 Tax=Alkalilimnicola ehrlichii TaxID=351052 RepID=A0A3E0WRP1_9GAMM|nr:glycerophosphodiester phosphodiesterase family protein [Alkalilimnicola ehrlichii]RFA28221.1 hypothetical protein CAI21_12895 [Alkalilimnicola ehrlichii]RFA34821.1 hypothetical protein CAL65_14030 [Alkalilimnicola ehrlichii]